jgi:hypothetical protein
MGCARNRNLGSSFTPNRAGKNLVRMYNPDARVAEG